MIRITSRRGSENTWVSSPILSIIALCLCTQSFWLITDADEVPFFKTRAERLDVPPSGGWELPFIFFTLGFIFVVGVCVVQTSLWRANVRWESNMLGRLDLSNGHVSFTGPIMFQISNLDHCFWVISDLSGSLAHEENMRYNSVCMFWTDSL